MYFIGIDLGTSSVKLLLVDELGNVVNSVTKDYPLYLNGLNSEQNPSDWWIQTKIGVKELIKGYDAKLIKGLSFGGQMHGLVMLDKNNEVIRPAILWNDGRSIEEVDYLNNVIGKKVLVEETGNFAFAGFTLPKLLWVKNHEKENFEKVNMIMLPKDYLAWCFSGKYSSDYSDAAGTLFLDVKNKKWSNKMCDIAGITVNNLPTLYESYEVVGDILENVADELGLPKDVKIIAGAGDNAAAAIGTGCVKDGYCNISLGTSGTIFISADKFVCDDDLAIHSFNHANGKYHLMGCILSAASCNKWWIENILNSTYQEEISDFKTLKNDVLFLPYLSGERCPYNDPLSKGAFINLTHTTTKKDMTLSIMEGVTFALYDCYDLILQKGINLSQLTICGGGAKNKIWAEIIANTFNQTVKYVTTEQGPGFGGAILSMVGTKIYNSVDKACDKLITYCNEIKPNQEMHEWYMKKYQKYHKLYYALKENNIYD